MGEVNLITRAQKIKLGVFLTTAFLILIITLLILGGSRLIEKRDNYFIRFSTSLSGLDVGSPVKYNGINVGRVEKIRLDRDNIAVTIVEISTDYGTPIKENTKAIVSTLGITGLKYIDLVGSTNDSPTISSGSEIPEGQSLLDNLTGKATTIALKTEMLIGNFIELTSENNRAKIENILVQTEKLISELAKTVEETRPLIVNSTKSLSEGTQQLNTTLGTLNKLVSSNEKVISNILKNTEEMIAGLHSQQSTIQRLLGNVNGTVEDFRKVINDGTLKEAIATANKTLKDVQLTVMRSRENLTAAIDYMYQASENFNDFSRIILENPSALFRKSSEQEERKAE